MANYPFYQPPMQPMYGQTAMYQNPYMGQPVAAPMAQQMPQTQAQMAANVPVQTASQPGFVCRPVASQEEAKAVPTDFSGNMLVMTDLSHGAIYTKVLDPSTGSSVFDMYRKVTEDQGTQETVSVAPVPAVDYTPNFTAIEERLDQMSDRVEDLFDRIESQKKAALRAERKAAAE